jgi:biopolymer transport protein ExbB/TolQ
MSLAWIGRVALLLMLAGGLRAEEAAETTLPVLDILAMGGWITWPIYALLLIGVAMSINRFLHLRMDTGKDTAVRGMKAAGLDTKEMRRKLQAMSPGSLTMAARDMIGQYEQTRNAESLQSAIEHHITVRQDGFKPYKNWMDFLSESAGALGLLGTVLGMFQTFFGGTLDKDKILHGMGVALITTLVGIIVSLLLNLLLTVLRNHFDKMLDGHYHKLSELRQAVLEQAGSGD